MAETVGGEEQGPGDVRELQGAPAAGLEDVLHQLRVAPGAIRYPELFTVPTVVGDEEQPTADFRQVGRRRILAARVDVLHQLRAALGAA